MSQTLPLQPVPFQTTDSVARGYCAGGRSRMSLPGYNCSGSSSAGAEVGVVVDYYNFVYVECFDAFRLFSPTAVVAVVARASDRGRAVGVGRPVGNISYPLGVVVVAEELDIETHLPRELLPVRYQHCLHSESTDSSCL